MTWDLTTLYAALAVFALPVMLLTGRESWLDAKPYRWPMCFVFIFGNAALCGRVLMWY